jgi:transposase
MTQQGRSSNVEEIREILRVYKLTGKIKETVRLLNCARGTVKKYVRWARKKGYLDQDQLPSAREIFEAWSQDKRPRCASSQLTLEPYREIITPWIEKGIRLTRIRELLVSRHGWNGNYEALKRFTRPLREDANICVRIEVAPGTEAQVDFGYMRLMWDPVEKRRRKLWVFLMTLSHSRHVYGELVFAQDTATWIGCHRRAFNHFGGVPGKLIMDNLKPAIIKAVLYDPLVNKTYRECAEHYGFIISPCKPGKPEHKGKVERGVPYVRGSFLPERDFRDLADANTQLMDWIMTVAGMRDHGTTRQKPLVVFDQVEAGTLKPLPSSPYELALWYRPTLHRDCHVTVDKSYYSAPHRYRGEELDVRLSDTMSHIFYEHLLIASHVRARYPGTRRTNPDHYPPAKVALMEKTPQWCLNEARRIGPYTYKFITAILTKSHPLDGLRRAQGILGLQRKYTRERLEGATRRALHFGVFTYQVIKKILKKEYDLLPLEAPEKETTPPAKKTYAFARPIEDFTHKAMH